MKKLWFCGFVVLFLIIAPVAADICTPIPNTGFCTVDGTTKYTYNEIPFTFTIFSNGVPDYLLYTAPGVTDTRLMNGYTATKIYFLDHAGKAIWSPTGYNAGKIAVYYKDGTFESVDLIIGGNIAEWAYDRPGAVSAHYKVPPAYSYPTNYESSYTYNAHFFYSSIITAPKPIDRIELQNTATARGVYLAIDAITLESAQNQPPVAAFEGTPASTTSAPITISTVGQLPSTNSGDSGFYLAVIIVLIMILCIGGVYSLNMMRKKHSADVAYSEQKPLSRSTSSDSTADNATKFRSSSFKNELTHHDIFISYSSEDKPIADAICNHLESQHIRCWVAPRDILPGMNYQEAIIDAIDSSSIMVLVFSSHSNESPHVLTEVNEAMSNGVIIIPFRIENILPSKAMKYLISGPHWLDAMTPPLEQHIRELEETIKILIERKKQK